MSGHRCPVGRAGCDGVHCRAGGSRCEGGLRPVHGIVHSIVLAVLLDAFLVAGVVVLIRLV